MANLKDVIYLSNEDYETLVSTGTVTIGGETLTYDPDNVYITPDEAMLNPMTAQGDIIIGGSSGAPSRLAKGNNGEILRVNSSGNISYGNNLPIITTAPSADNTDGIILCVLSNEPATKYNGYLYIVTGSN